MDDFPRLSLDLYSSETVDLDVDHFAKLDRVRAAHPAFWNADKNGYWVLTRYDDIREASLATSVFSNRSIVATRPNPDPSFRFIPSTLDPPELQRFRSLTNRWFSARSVERLVPQLQATFRNLLDSFADDGQVEFLGAVGDQYTSAAIAHVLGLPEEDRELYIEFNHRLDVDAVAALTQLKEYFRGLIADRRSSPRNPETDFLTHVLEARIDDEPISPEDLEDLCMTTLMGGLDTTKYQLAWALWHLAVHSDDRQLLVREPAAIPTAVEEFLRAYTFVGMARKLNQDVEFQGCPMHRDDMVLLLSRTGNRDPEVFPDPDRVDLRRRPNRHIAFGAGPHMCVGMHLARASIRVALEEWHLRIPEYRVADGAQLRTHGGQLFPMYSLRELPLQWSSAA